MSESSSKSKPASLKVRVLIQSLEQPTEEEAKVSFQIPKKANRNKGRGIRKVAEDYGYESDNEEKKEEKKQEKRGKTIKLPAPVFDAADTGPVIDAAADTAPVPRIRRALLPPHLRSRSTSRSTSTATATTTATARSSRSTKKTPPAPAPASDPHQHKKPLRRGSLPSLGRSQPTANERRQRQQRRDAVRAREQEKSKPAPKVSDTALSPIDEETMEEDQEGM